MNKLIIFILLFSIKLKAQDSGYIHVFTHWVEVKQYQKESWVSLEDTHIILDLHNGLISINHENREVEVKPVYEIKQDDQGVWSFIDNDSWEYKMKTFPYYLSISPPIGESKIIYK